jgi:hypothetical protein
MNMLPGTGIGRDLVEIASLLIAVALVSMLVRNAQGTTQIIQTGGNVFSTLLQTATGGGQY